MPPPRTAAHLPKPTTKQPIKLQTVSALRVKRPDKGEINPCLGPMSAMLQCWASSGNNPTSCNGLEQALRDCMDTKKPPPKPKSTINYHLQRLYPNISGPRKK